MLKSENYKLIFHINYSLQGDFYRELKKLNVFINQPDSYFYQGGNKVGMGYSEHQFSLPRLEDITVSRMVSVIILYLIFLIAMIIS